MGPVVSSLISFDLALTAVTTLALPFLAVTLSNSSATRPPWRTMSLNASSGAPSPPLASATSTLSSLPPTPASRAEILSPEVSPPPTAGALDPVVSSAIAGDVAPFDSPMRTT